MNSIKFNAEVDLIPTIALSVKIICAQMWLLWTMRAPLRINALSMSSDVCVKGAHRQYVGVVAILKISSVEYELLKRYAVLE